MIEPTSGFDKGNRTYMRGGKKYTTQTFTKKPDHEGGAHREPRKQSEPAFCSVCGSVYADSRWTTRESAKSGKKHPHWRPGHETMCPACTQIQNGIVGGYLTISGGFPKSHRAEIERLMSNEAERALEDNPLSRIMRTVEKGDELVVETTTEHLAQRLGHSLRRAYAGEVTYRFSHENKIARVSWNRD